MNDDDLPADNENDSPAGSPESHEIRHSQLSALVPDHVRRGVFSTGAVVLQGPHEFIVDFLLRMTRPHQVAARVVLAPPVLSRLIAALRENLQKYDAAFGSAATGPAKTPAENPPSQSSSPESSSPAATVAGESQPAGNSTAAAKSEPGPTTVSDQSNAAHDLYDQLKLSDDVMSGTYANAVMIGHTATEFSFDFITTFFPRSAVACRVFMAAPNARRFLDSIAHSFEQYQRKQRNQPPPTKPPESN